MPTQKNATKPTATKKAAAAASTTRTKSKSPSTTAKGSTAKAATAKKPAKAATKSSTAKAATAKSAAATSVTKRAAKAAPKTRNVPKDTTVTKRAPAAKAKAAAKPAAIKSPFDKKFLDQQRKLLEGERAKYLKSAVQLKAEADALVAEREPGDVQFDEESGEGDTLAVERDFDLARSAQANHQVQEIDAALARIESGTYGICRVSGDPIPKERLQAIPWATERVEYKVGGFSRR